MKIGTLRASEAPPRFKLCAMQKRMILQFEMDRPRQSLRIESPRPELRPQPAERVVQRRTVQAECQPVEQQREIAQPHTRPYLAAARGEWLAHQRLGPRIPAQAGMTVVGLRRDKATRQPGIDLHRVVTLQTSLAQPRRQRPNPDP